MEVAAPAHGVVCSDLSPFIAHLPSLLILKVYSQQDYAAAQHHEKPTALMLQPLNP